MEKLTLQNCERVLAEAGFPAEYIEETKAILSQEDHLRRSLNRNPAYKAWEAEQIEAEKAEEFDFEISFYPKKKRR
jgi:hypothetical protein